MATYTIYIRRESVAFSGGDGTAEEITRLLEFLIFSAAEYGRAYTGPLCDLNGNKIGEARWTI